MLQTDPAGVIVCRGTAFYSYWMEVPPTRVGSMRKLALSKLKPGMVLGKTIYNGRGDPLLTRGTVLTERYLDALAARGFAVVCIQDQETEDILIEDFVSERVRTTVTRNVGRVYDLMEQAIRPMREASTRAIVAGLNTVTFRRQACDENAFARLYVDVEQVIDEILESEDLSGLTTLKSHDNYTFCHSVDVTVVALAIGRQFTLDRVSLRRLAIGCLLHDIGKVFVNPAVLTKPGKLTDEEFDRLKWHTTLGYELLRQTQAGDLLANHIAFQHHERQDGSGYPRGLRGDNRLTGNGLKPAQCGRILLLAEIAAVADVYDALTSDRPYRRALPPERVASVIRDMAGPHLNRVIVDQFLAVLPVYPIGGDVVVTNGRFQNCRGVVARLNPDAIDRPVVRLLADSQGEPIRPLDLDLRYHPDVSITTASA